MHSSYCWHFGARHLQTQPSALTLEQLDVPLVLAFLADLESARGNSARTRNARLGAIKSFAHYLEYRVPSCLQQIKSLLASPAKKTDEKLIPYRKMDEMPAVLDAPAPSTFDVCTRRSHTDTDLQLIRKWLRAGVFENAVRRVQEIGSPQGAPISPLLANVYLHYVFDLWSGHWRRKHARGDVIVVRCADDIVLGFRYKADALCFWSDLRERLRKFCMNFTLRRPDCCASVLSPTFNERTEVGASRRRSIPWGSRTSVRGQGSGGSMCFD